jgi:hypothetical protein
LFRFDTVLELTRVPHSASVMSSTRRTETPARYISISASSTESLKMNRFSGDVCGVETKATTVSSWRWSSAWSFGA